MDEETWQAEADLCGHVIEVSIGDPHNHDCELTRTLRRMQDRIDALERHAYAAQGRLAELLHREDLTGRAIHEDAYCMQVPSFEARECRECPSIAGRMYEAGATVRG